MRFVSKYLKQKAVYWAPITELYSGEVQYSPPYQVICRWEDYREQFIDEFGNDVVSNSRVLLLAEVKVRGILWLGSISNLLFTTIPTKNNGAYEIRRVNKIPDLKAKVFLYEALL